MMYYFKAGTSRGGRSSSGQLRSRGPENRSNAHFAGAESVVWLGVCMNLWLPYCCHSHVTTSARILTRQVAATTGRMRLPSSDGASRCSRASTDRGTHPNRR